jgi:uncharacterized protein (TIGR02594 family)
MHYGFRALLVMFALAMSAYATPSMARPRHHSIHANGHHHVSVRHHARASRHSGRRYARHRRHLGREGIEAAQVEQKETPSLFGGGFGSSNVVSEARRWIGTNPTNRSSLWCAAFMNFVLQRTGHSGSGSNLAQSFARYGERVSGPQVGAIAVMSRRGGGHVGVVSGLDPNGNPIVISGNHGHRVAESVYPRGRIYAYVMPGSGSGS